ncbi:hypothetical protein RDI58_028838 [Solanum bulbocastanum]|uniref:DUF4218 domain-containing protein n=1 Tax=Solanum bulbocastanum TaxID=147425 RepID=A0AAN8SQW8_SOLBU
MDVKGKTKDNPKARMDIKEYCRRKELWLQELQNGKIIKPKASFPFTLDEKHEIIEWVKNLRMLEGYALNLGKRADMNEEKLMGMKSHDCHVFMETLIPITFSHLPERIWKPIIEISIFLKDLCSGKLLESSLNRMEKNILVTTAMLEKIFPCGFFDVMEHLSIHLVQEAHLGGPVQTRWIKIGSSKQTIKQRGRIEESFVQGDVDGIGQTIEYYGIIQEIIEVRYSSWPKKKIVLFQCEWFDPSHRGTKVDHQHNIIEVKHNRKYTSYDPFIIAQNIKQVYYASYPLRRDKAD